MTYTATLTNPAQTAVTVRPSPNPNRCSQTPNSTCAVWPGTHCAMRLPL
ncbi:hypothetical protein [Pseudomonas tolaasii]